MSIAPVLCIRMVACAANDAQSRPRRQLSKLESLALSYGVGKDRFLDRLELPALIFFQMLLF